MWWTFGLVVLAAIATTWFVSNLESYEEQLAKGGLLVAVATRDDATTGEAEHILAAHGIAYERIGRAGKGSDGKACRTNRQEGPAGNVSECQRL